MTTKFKTNKIKYPRKHKQKS